MVEALRSKLSILPKPFVGMKMLSSCFSLTFDNRWPSIWSCQHGIQMDIDSFKGKDTEVPDKQYMVEKKITHILIFVMHWLVL